MKDNFSSQAALYAQSRPQYPTALFEYLIGLIDNYKAAWDCATGNGQVATVLAQHFDKVYATDISEQQLAHAVKKDNIFYSLQSAEQTNFPNKCFDLITVAQAIHWFDFEHFYDEVKRTLKPKGVLAVIGYHNCTIDNDIDSIIQEFYYHTIGTYWDVERKYIDEAYQTIPFPFEDLDTPAIHLYLQWNLEQFIYYVQTWSAVQHFIRARGFNPCEHLKNKLQEKWEATAIKTICFPILLRVARL